MCCAIIYFTLKLHFRETRLYELSLECGGSGAIGQQIYVHEDWRRRNTFRIVRRITAARRLGFFGGTWHDEETRATWL